MKKVLFILTGLCCIFFIIVTFLKAINADLPQYADRNEAGFYLIVAIIFGVMAFALKMDSPNRNKYIKKQKL